MAGVRGNVGWFMFAKQAAQGTAATIATGTTIKVPVSGGSIGPVRTVDHLSETDSSRDIGVAFVSTSGVEGTPECYVRDASIGALLLYALGADAVTGTTNYTHTLTPSTALPYVTAWRNVGDLLWERYTDCKVSGLTISAEAGQPLKAAVNLRGITPTRLTSDPSTSPAIAIESTTAYNFNNATVTLAGGATTLVRSFELAIENNVTAQQTDDVLPIDVVEGIRQVSLSFELVFSSLAEYNKFHYGGASGTTVSSSIYTTDATFDFPLGANNAVKFTLPSIAYEEFPVDLNPDGSPVTVQVRAVAQRSGSPVLTAEVKNQTAAY